MMKIQTREAGDYSGPAIDESAADALAADGDWSDEDLAAPVSDPEPLQLKVGTAHAGQRLDVALAALVDRYSRSRLQAWIRAQRVLVDGKPCTDVRRPLHGGERIEVRPQLDPSEVAAMPEPIDFPIVYEDDALIVIDKPAGLVVHPGSGNWQGTLLNGLLHHAPQLASVPRAGIVHRLDKDTSGLMVVARTLAAQTDLVRQLQARTVRREYLAVAQGVIDRAGTVDAPIGRHPTQRVRMAVVPNGKPAVTHYRPLEGLRGATLVGCALETGRTHQIRVHLAHLGHPLLGDALYGGPRAAFPRQALHATRLGLIHPGNGRAMQWESPLPNDLEWLAAALRDG